MHGEVWWIRSAHLGPVLLQAVRGAWQPHIPAPIPATKVDFDGATGVVGAFIHNDTLKPAAITVLGIQAISNLRPTRHRKHDNAPHTKRVVASVR